MENTSNQQATTVKPAGGDQSNSDQAGQSNPVAGTESKEEATPETVVDEINQKGNQEGGEDSTNSTNQEKAAEGAAKNNEAKERKDDAEGESSKDGAQTSEEKGEKEADQEKQKSDENGDKSKDDNDMTGEKLDNDKENNNGLEKEEDKDNSNDKEEAKHDVKEHEDKGSKGDEKQNAENGSGEEPENEKDKKTEGEGDGQGSDSSKTESKDYESQAVESKEDDNAKSEGETHSKDEKDQKDKTDKTSKQDEQKRDGQRKPSMSSLEAKQIIDEFLTTKNPEEETNGGIDAGNQDKKDPKSTMDVLEEIDSQLENVLKDISNKDEKEKEETSTVAMKKLDAIQTKVSSLRDAFGKGEEDAEPSKGNAEKGQDEELRNVVLSLKRRHKRMKLKYEELLKREAAVKYKEEILSKRKQEIEQHVREFVDNAKKLTAKSKDIKRREAKLSEHEGDMEKRLLDLKEKENDVFRRERFLKTSEDEVAQQLDDIKMREKQVDILKRKTNQLQRENLETQDELLRKEHHLRKEKQRIRHWENAIKIQETDVKYKLDASKRKEAEIRRKLEEVEEESEKLEVLKQQIDAEKRREKNKKDVHGPPKAPDSEKLIGAVKTVEKERNLQEIEDVLIQKQFELARREKLLVQRESRFSAYMKKLEYGGNGLRYSEGFDGEETSGGPYNTVRYNDNNPEGHERQDYRDLDEDDIPNRVSGDGDFSDDDDDPSQSYTVFDIYLNTLVNKQVKIPVKTAAAQKVYDLKVALQKAGIPMHWQRLYEKGKVLKDDRMLQDTSRIQLRLIIPPGKPKEKLKLKLSGPFDKAINLEANKDEPIALTKARILRLCGLLPASYALLLGDKELRNNDTLDSYKIRNGMQLNIRIL